MPKPQVFSWSLKLHWGQLSCVSGIIGFSYFAERGFPFILFIYVTNPQFNVDQCSSVLCCTLVSLWSFSFPKITPLGPDPKPDSWFQALHQYQTALDHDLWLIQGLSIRELLCETKNANYIAGGACPFLLSEKLNSAIKNLKPSLHHLHRKLQLEAGLW